MSDNPFDQYESLDMATGRIINPKAKEPSFWSQVGQGLKDYYDPSKPRQAEDKAGSFLAGFKRPFQRFAQGIEQPLVESGLFGQTFANSFRNQALREERQHQANAQENPWSAGLGELSGDIGLTMPLGGGAGAVLNKAVPITAKAYPWVQKALQGSLGAGALYGANYVNPGESRLKNVEKGAALGGAIGIASPAIGKTASFAGKNIARAFGGTKTLVNDILENMTKKEIESALKKSGAAKKLGIHLTPGQSSGNIAVQQLEKGLGSTKEGQRKLSEYTAGQAQKQKGAIREMLDIVSASEKPVNKQARDLSQSILKSEREKMQKKASPYFKKAEKDLVSANKINALIKKDGNIEKAFGEVVDSKVYKAELKKAPRNSIEVLKLVKERLDDKIKEAIKSGRNNEARVLKNSQKKLLSLMDAVSDNYKIGRAIYEQEHPHLKVLNESVLGSISKLTGPKVKNIGKMVFDPADPDMDTFMDMVKKLKKADSEVFAGMVKDELSRRAGTISHMKQGTVGSHFYDKALKNDIDFKKFHYALRGNLPAQRKLTGLRDVFKDLNYDVKKPYFNVTPEGGQGIPGSATKAAYGMVRKYFGGKYDKAMIELVTSDKWTKEFEKVMSGKNKKEGLLGLLDEISGDTKRNLATAAKLYQKEPSGYEEESE